MKNSASLLMSKVFVWRIKLKTHARDSCQKQGSFGVVTWLVKQLLRMAASCIGSEAPLLSSLLTSWKVAHNGLVLELLPPALGDAVEIQGCWLHPGPPTGFDGHWGMNQQIKDFSVTLPLKNIKATSTKMKDKDLVSY